MGERCKKTEALAHPGPFAERKNTMQEVILSSFAGHSGSPTAFEKAYQSA